MPDPGKVLVTGATGFVGYEVARQLCARGTRPRLLVRRPLRAALLGSLDAEPVQGELESPASLERTVEGVDTIFHLGARAIFEEYELVRPTIVDGSVALMRGAGGCRRRFPWAGPPRSPMLVNVGTAGPEGRARTCSRPALAGAAANGWR